MAVPPTSPKTALLDRHMAFNPGGDEGALRREAVRESLGIHHHRSGQSLSHEHLLSKQRTDLDYSTVSIMTSLCQEDISLPGYSTL